MKNPLTTLLIREPVEVYEAKRASHVTAHSLKEYAQCPYTYKLRQDGLLPRRESSAFRFGGAAHCYILEGREEFERRWLVGGPVNPKTGKCFGHGTKAYEEWAEAQDRPVISDEDAATIQEMAASVRAHKLASKLLSNGVAEGVLRTNLIGLDIQSRFDYIREPLEADGPYIIVDLKTCSSLDKFEEDFNAYGYAFQLAFYQFVFMESIGTEAQPDVKVVAVEKEAPYRVGVFAVHQRLLDCVFEDIMTAFDDLHMSIKTGVFTTLYQMEQTFVLDEGVNP
jgi:hypothetical protein